MAEVSEKRKRGNNEKSQGCQQGHTVRRLQFLDIEHFHERRQDERSRYKSCDVRINHNQNAPVQLDFVRIDVSRYLFEEGR